MARRVSKRISGLSKSIAVHSHRGRSRTVTVLQAGRQAERIREMTERRKVALEALPIEDQAAVDRMYADLGVEVHYDEPMPFCSAESDKEDDDDDGYDTEDEFIDLTEHISSWRPPDTRNRRDRIAIQHDQWGVQMTRLADAYLDYRSRDSGDGLPKSAEPALEANEEPSEYPPGTVVDIELVDVFTRWKATLIARQGLLYPNENLLCHGYIGCSPMYPSVAISLRTLAAFRQAHRSCPRFSIQAQCKALCHLHHVPYRPYLCTQFTLAYDIYLEILDHIDKRISCALGRDSQEWRLRNECPACFYRLEDEPNLTFNWLVSIDGNNSLKRWDTTTYGMMPRDDSRQPRSTYWLTNEEVDKFKYEVAARKTAGPSNDPHDDDWEMSANPDVISEKFNCVDRWRNARSDQHKTTRSVFQETGVFVASCRHRFVLLACDMIKSGELAKYPLAIVDHLLSAYGPNGGCAYDIGCAFAKTADNSVIGPRVRALNLRFMVGSFHGHAHNRLCQLQWHPMYIEGVGNTEGEGCEHIFSASNELARSVRHSTRFHRHQAIEEHFAFWNADKYEALTRFIRNHYRDATETVRSLSTELAVLKQTLNLRDEDFQRFLSEEQAYLSSVQHAPPREQLSIQYVQVLDDLEEQRTAWLAACEKTTAAATSVAPADLTAATVTIRNTRIERELIFMKLQQTTMLASRIQGQLGLENPWTIGCAEYNLYKEEARLRQYRKALGELERLVVMRLFELTKASLTGTGYKLRQQISKALQRRSEAIRKAIARYNTQATALNPPRPTITWKDITKYTILGEFDLLQQARNDVHDQEWARPAVCEATAKFFKICRAKEEITRLNVEMHRLRTAILDEEKKISTAISELMETDKLLAIELRHLHRSRAAVNRLHIDRLDRIQKKFGDERELISRLTRGASDGNGLISDTVDHDERSEGIPEVAPDEWAPHQYDFSEVTTLHERPTLDPDNFDDIYRMYINDPGDDDILDEEEETNGLQAMADFLHEIVD